MVENRAILTPIPLAIGRFNASDIHSPLCEYVCLQTCLPLIIPVRPYIWTEGLWTSYRIKGTMALRPRGYAFPNSFL